jgi:hypothetical protein
MWWHILAIPALRKVRQEGAKLESSLGYIVTPCLKKKTKTKKEERKERKKVENVFQ